MADPASIVTELADRPIYAVTSAHAGRDNVQIATWIMPVTLVPEQPRVVAAISVCNFTHGLIAASRRFVMHHLAVGQEEWLPRFGLQSGRDTDKLAGIELRRTRSGLPILPGVAGWAEGVVVEEIDIGDRMIYVADLVEGEVHEEREPMHQEDAFAALPQETVDAMAQKRLDDGVRDARLMKRYR